MCICESRIWRCVAIGAIVAPLIGNASAQHFPVKPIRILCPVPPGGSVDSSARLAAQKLTEAFGQSVVVENVTGAAGAISIERTIAAAPDGYTLVAFPASGAALPVIRNDLTFDIDRDLAPVTLLTVGPSTMNVHPSLPVRNVAELIALARAHPGKLSYGSGGYGNSLHFMGELFKVMAKVNMVHVPYKGGVASAVGNAIGEVDISFATLTIGRPMIAAGKLKALAITSIKRTSFNPSLPTLDESGLPGYEREGWTGLSTNVRVPKDIVMRLNAALVKGLNTPEAKEVLKAQDMEPATNTPEQFGAHIRREIAENIKLVKLTGMKFN
jgi:tripartite-type tricarboxylate transporter receptor subunit TctC